MTKYIVELVHASNEDLVIAERLLEFNLEVESIEEAVELAIKKVSSLSISVNRREFYLTTCSDRYAEFCFGDYETNSDVLYRVMKK